MFPQQQMIYVTEKIERAENIEPNVILVIARCF